MAYQKGDTIEAVHYNTFVQDMNQVFSTTASSDQTFNYGISPLAASIKVGDDITAAQWNSLLETVRRCAAHQGTSISGAIPLSVKVGDDIVAITDLPAAISSLRTNRLKIDPSEYSLKTQLSMSVTKSWTTKLSQTITIRFSDDDNARYFFNAGGEIRIESSKSATRDINNAWEQLLSSVGIVRFNWEKTVSSNGLTNNTGFYNLTTSLAEILSASPASPDYGLEKYQISASYNKTSATLIMEINWISGHAGNETITGTISSTITEAKSSGEISSSGPVSYTSTEITGS